ncbi:hypothetical protein ACKVMT_04510 [Halobacteriales archaeon Cl-PHB]
MVGTLLSTSDGAATGAVNAAGAVLIIGGILLTALWLHYLYR